MDAVARLRGAARRRAKPERHHCLFRRAPRHGVRRRKVFGADASAGLFADDGDADNDGNKANGISPPSYNRMLVAMWERKAPQRVAPPEATGAERRTWYGVSLAPPGAPAAAAVAEGAAMGREDVDASHAPPHITTTTNNNNNNKDDGISTRTAAKDSKAPASGERLSFREMCWTCVQVSRPGMWCASVSCFLFPLCTTMRIADPALWLGVLYFTLPFNLLIMGWNDICDWDVDQYNERKKGRGIWGIRATKPELAVLPYWILAVNVPFWVAFVACGVVPAEGMAVWLVDACAASFFYNGVWDGCTPQLSRAPVIDLFMNVWLWFGAFHMGYLVGGGAARFMLPGLTPEAVGAAPLTGGPWFKRDFAPVPTHRCRRSHKHTFVAIARHAG